MNSDIANVYNSNNNKNDHILHIEAVIIIMNCNHDNKSIMLITFRNATFNKNEFGILNVTSSVLPIYFEPISKRRLIMWGQAKRISYI